LEAELRVEAKRAIVVGRLQEPHPGDAAARTTLDHIEHQPTADPLVLRAGIDRYRADAGNRTALVEKVAADHLAVALGNDPIDPGMGQQHLHQARRNLRRREIPPEVVLARDRLERLVANRATGPRIRGNALPQDHRHRSPFWRFDRYFVPERLGPRTRERGLLSLTVNRRIIAFWPKVERKEPPMLTREENELVTRVGPGTPMGDVLRRYWIPALMSRELPEADCPPVRVKLLGEKLVGFRDSQGRIGVVDEFCPHRRASLWC